VAGGEETGRPPAAGCRSEWGAVPPGGAAAASGSWRRPEGEGHGRIEEECRRAKIEAIESNRETYRSAAKVAMKTARSQETRGVRERDGGSWDLRLGEKRKAATWADLFLGWAKVLTNT
jgi:hypothetical protein